MKILNPDKKAGKKTIASVTTLLPTNIIVFSHLRWDFVFQRPQHLLTRMAGKFNIFFIEEPIFTDTDKPAYSLSKRGDKVWVMVPHLPHGTKPEVIKNTLKALFDRYMENKQLSDYAFWYYTPMALEFSRKHTPELIVYDCMDELSNFMFAPVALPALEKELLNLSDVVFTGGRSLYEAKKNQHANIHAFPSSIDTAHFSKTRKLKAAAPVQKNKPFTLGFFGVIDERFDIALIKGIADSRPNWQLNIIGPVVKIDENILPKNKNIVYSGSVSYQDLPSHLSNWDMALIPFLINDSTKFISPTKTPEYLAAGLPVISTAIRDVVNPYGISQYVQIASNYTEFTEAAENFIALSKKSKEKWLAAVDTFLTLNSWDKTCDAMVKLMKEASKNKSYASIAQ